MSKFRRPVKREIFFIHVVRTGRFGEGKSPGRKRPGIFTRFDRLWLQNELQTLDKKVLAFQERGRRPNSQSRLANGLAASTCSLFPSSNNLSPGDQHVMELSACWPRLRAGRGDLGRVVSCLGISAIEPPNSKDIVQVGCCNLHRPAPLALSCRKDSGRRRIHRSDRGEWSRPASDRELAGGASHRHEEARRSRKFASVLLYILHRSHPAHFATPNWSEIARCGHLQSGLRLWRITPDASVAVSIKRNADMHAHEQRRAGGYMNIKAQRRIDAAPIRPGALGFTRRAPWT